MWTPEKCRQSRGHVGEGCTILVAVVTLEVSVCCSRLKRHVGCTILVIVVAFEASFVVRVSNDLNRHFICMGAASFCVARLVRT